MVIFIILGSPFFTKNFKGCTASEMIWKASILFFSKFVIKPYMKLELKVKGKG